MDAKILRQQTLSRRDALTGDEQLRRSRLIMERAVNLPQFIRANTIFVYVSFRSEVDTGELINTMLQLKKTVVVPVTLVQKKALLPVAITDPKLELASGYCNIPEPIAEIRDSQRVSPETIDLIFLPGSVFDERGGRLGYGGGYYDRFVSTLAPQALRVGLAYEEQVVKEAPLQEHDELLDLILTEKRTLSGGRPKSYKTY